MRERLRRFAVVGLVATTIDIGLAVILLGAGWDPWAADAIALGLAATVARLLHRSLTLRDDPYARWIRLRRVFVTVVVIAGLVDFGVLTVARSLLDGLLDGDTGSWTVDLGAKLAAVVVAGAVRAVAYRAFLFPGDPTGAGPSLAPPNARRRDTGHHGHSGLPGGRPDR